MPKTKNRPWENVKHQLGLGAKTTEDEIPPVKTVQTKDTVGYHDSTAQAVEAHESPERQSLQDLKIEVSDDFLSDEMLELRSKYSKHGGYHWQCAAGHCFYAKTNKPVCPDCERAGRDMMAAIFDIRRVSHLNPGQYESYRGGQTWTKSANGQMAKLAARRLKAHVSSGEPLVAAEPETEEQPLAMEVLGAKPPRFFVEWLDAKAYQAEMERVGGEEDQADIAACTRTVDCANIAVARGKKAMLEEKKEGEEVKIIERKNLRQNGGNQWLFDRYIAED